MEQELLSEMQALAAEGSDALSRLRNLQWQLDSLADRIRQGKTGAEIQALVKTLRSLGSEPGWPHAELLALQDRLTALDLEALAVQMKGLAKQVEKLYSAGLTVKAAGVEVPMKRPVPVEPGWKVVGRKSDERHGERFVVALKDPDARKKREEKLNAHRYEPGMPPVDPDKYYDTQRYYWEGDSSKWHNKPGPVEGLSKTELAYFDPKWFWRDDNPA